MKTSLFRIFLLTMLAGGLARGQTTLQVNNQSGLLNRGFKTNNSSPIQFLNGAVVSFDAGSTLGITGAFVANPQAGSFNFANITVSNFPNVGGGNVTHAAPLGLGNVVIGSGSGAIETTPTLQVAAGNVTVNGNLTVTGTQEMNGLQVNTLNVIGEITTAGLGNGTLLIGNATSGNFAQSTLTAGDGVTITNGPGAITINATGSGNIITSGSPSSGQTAEFTSSSAITGVANSGTGSYLKGNSPTITTPTLVGNITHTTVTDGQIYVGNNTGDRLQPATLTAGDGISITNGAGSITINATTASVQPLAYVSVYSTSNVTTANNNNVISFTNVAHDTTGGSLWNVSDPTKLGGPSGVPSSWNGLPVKFEASAIWASGVTSDYRELKIFKNGDTLNPVAVIQVPPALQNTGLALPSRPIIVATGDYFELCGRSNGTETILAADFYSPYFSMQLMASAAGPAGPTGPAGGGDVTGSSLTANAVIVGGGSSAIQAIASLGNSGAPLLSAGAGAPPAFGPINLAGGSNIVTGPLPVNVGGTGLATLTANNIITGNGTGTPILIAPGTTGNVVTSNGTGFNSAAPTWFGSAIVSGCTTVTANSTGNLTFVAGGNITITTDNTAKSITIAASGGGSGGTKTLRQWTAIDNQPPVSNFAVFDTINAVALLSYVDGTDTSGIFVGNIPEAADLSNGISVIIKWVDSATSGAVVWVSAFEAGATAINSDSFASGISATTSTSGTAWTPNTTTINHSSSEIDGLAAGDLFRLKLTRDADNGSDTLSVSAGVVSVEIRSR